MNTSAVTTKETTQAREGVKTLPKSIEKNPPPLYTRIAVGMQARVPRIFAVARVVKKALQHIWKRRVWTLPMAMLILAAFGIAFLPATFAFRIPYLLGLSSLLLTGALLYFAYRAYVLFEALTVAIQKESNQVVGVRRTTDGLSSRLRDLQDLYQTLQHQHGLMREGYPRQVNNLRADLDDLAARFDLRFDGQSKETSQLAASLQKEIRSAEHRVEEHRNLALASQSKTVDDRFFAQEEAFAAGIRGVEDAIQSLESRAEEAFAARIRGVEDAIQSLESRAEDAALLTAPVQETAAKVADLTTSLPTVAREAVADVTTRLDATDQQLRDVLYKTPARALILFGHHKCASRYFRTMMSERVAKMTGARVRKYYITNPPFHFSDPADLDLCNIDFENFGENGNEVVLFSNATMRAVEKVRKVAGDDWRGLRIIRDPRQVLVSNYFHHRSGHWIQGDEKVGSGFVWDKLAEDRPALEELPKEKGILHELDNISKTVIEDQILGSFEDDRILTIKLEEFSSHPAAHLQQIATHLQLPLLAGLSLEPVGANSRSGDWQNHFTSEIRAHFKDRYGKALIDLGYADDLDW